MKFTPALALLAFGLPYVLALPSSLDEAPQNWLIKRQLGGLPEKAAGGGLSARIFGFFGRKKDTEPNLSEPKLSELHAEPHAEPHANPQAEPSFARHMTKEEPHTGHVSLAKYEHDMNQASRLGAKKIALYTVGGLGVGGLAGFTGATFVHPGQESYLRPGQPTNAVQATH